MRRFAPIVVMLALAVLSAPAFASVPPAKPQPAPLVLPAAKPMPASLLQTPASQHPFVDEFYPVVDLLQDSQAETERVPSARKPHRFAAIYSLLSFVRNRF